MARFRILASRTIISVDGDLAATAQLFELRDHFFLVHFGQRCGEPVGGSLEFAKISRLICLRLLRHD